MGKGQPTAEVMATRAAYRETHRECARPYRENGTGLWRLCGCLPELHHIVGHDYEIPDNFYMLGTAFAGNCHATWGHGVHAEKPGLRRLRMFAVKWLANELDLRVVPMLMKGHTWWEPWMKAETTIDDMVRRLANEMESLRETERATFDNWRRR